MITHDQTIFSVRKHYVSHKELVWQEIGSHVCTVKRNSSSVLLILHA